ncbi:MAG: hypothetical protein GXO58_01485 [Thermodesulfobacteria bacterium]|nr:hypothetical protein [Thermodesulfobacteriota bacterium]
MSLSVASIKQLAVLGIPAILLTMGSLIILIIGLSSQDREPILDQFDPLNIELPYIDPDITKKIKKHDHLYAKARDPFLLSTRPEEPVKDLPQLKLTMIIVNNRHKMCKVNGKLYREGEKGPDFLVKFIGEEKVLVEREGKGQWLFLSQNI